MDISANTLEAIKTVSEVVKSIALLVVGALLARAGARYQRRVDARHRDREELRNAYAAFFALDVPLLRALEDFAVGIRKAQGDQALRASSRERFQKTLEDDVLPALELTRIKVILIDDDAEMHRLLKKETLTPAEWSVMSGNDEQAYLEMMEGLRSRREKQIGLVRTRLARLS